MLLWSHFYIFACFQTFASKGGLLEIEFLVKQDGPSLESSSYLNVTLRYLGPWDPWTLGPSSISYYLLVCYGLEWGGVSDDYGPF